MALLVRSVALLVSSLALLSSVALHVKELLSVALLVSSVALLVGSVALLVSSVALLVKELLSVALLSGIRQHRWITDARRGCNQSHRLHSKKKIRPRSMLIRV